MGLSSVWLLSLLLLGLLPGCADRSPHEPEPPASRGPARAAEESSEPAVDSTRVFLARKIITMEPDRPEASAVAVADGRILACGSLSSVASALGPRRYQIDRSLADKILLPGFIDNHLHPALAAVLLPGEFATPYDWQLPGRVVKGVQGREAYLARLRELDARMKDADDWLIVWGYHPDFHGELSRSDLDDTSNERPILVWHRSFHEIYLNSTALKVWGLDQEQVAGHPAIDYPKGRFYETGLYLIRSRLASLVLAPDRYREGLRVGRELFHMGGLTTIADQGIPIFDLDLEQRLIQQVYENDETPFRSILLPNGMTLGRRYGNEAALALMEELPRRNSHRVRFVKQVKLFADGAFYSQLMQMKDGYLDGHHGEWLMTPAELESAARFYWNAGWPIHVHVNGDLGVEVVLGILEKLQAERPKRDHRFTLHHLGYATDTQARRIAALGALVSANPFYLWALGDKYAESGLGPERAQQIAAIASLVRRGIRTSLHSDLTMAPARPLTLAWVAVNRISANGNVLAPEQRISVAEALRAITIDAAYALHLEHEIGSLAPGKRADFTVLEQDPYAVPPERLKDIPIWGTVFEGRPYPLEH